MLNTAPNTNLDKDEYMLSSYQAEKILLNHFDALHITLQKVKEVILELRGALMNNSQGSSFLVVFEERTRRDEFNSSSTQEKLCFCKKKGNYYATV